MIKCKNSCPNDCFDGCCFECEKKDQCKEACELIPSECGDSIIDDGEANMQLFQQGQMALIQLIADVCITKKKLEEKEADLKAKLKEAMETCNIKKFESDILNITYVAATTATTVDSKKLKEKHPEIYEECSKTSNKSAYVKVVVK